MSPVIVDFPSLIRQTRLSILTVIEYILLLNSYLLMKALIVLVLVSHGHDMLINSKWLLRKPRIDFEM